MLSKLKTNAAVELLSRVNHLFSSICWISQMKILAMVLSGLTVCSAQARDAQTANLQDFQLHGFISQGLIDVDGSDFVNDDGELSAELTELGINSSYQLNDKFRFAGQVVYLDGGNRYAQGLRLDYALMDWLALINDKWQANIYLGRFKNNHWLYSSSRDVPFARPSIILPQSVYFDGLRDIAVGSDGVALKISYSCDVYGNFDGQFSYGTSPIAEEQTKNILGENALGDSTQDYDVKSSLYWQPVFSSWRFGLSLLHEGFTYDSAGMNQGDLYSDANFTLQLYTLNALYEGEIWEFSGEVYQQRFIIDGFYQPGFNLDNTGQGYYLQSRYKATEKMTFLVRYEDFYLDKEDKDGKQLEQNSSGQVPFYFGFHKDITLGLNYDITSNFSARMEYHWVNGTGRLTPVVAPNPSINSSENWQMWAVQLMYWF